MPTFDTANIQTFIGTGGSQTIGSFTIGTNSNRLLLVFIVGDGSAGTPSWNGTPMTQFANGRTNSGVGENYGVFYLVAPATGAHTLTGTFINGAGYGVIWYSLYNCSATQLDNTNQSDGSGASAVTLTLTPTNDSDMVVYVGFAGGTISTLTGATNNQVGVSQAGSSGTYALVGNIGLVSPVTLQSATLNGTSMSYTMFALAIKTLTQTSSPSLTMANSASRLATETRAVQNIRTSSLTVMNAASRLATVAFNYWRTRTLTSTAVIFSTALASLGGIWKTLTKDVSSFVNTAWHSSSWTNGTKDASTFTNAPKSTPS